MESRKGKDFMTHEASDPVRRSRKNSSSSSDFNDYKMDKFDRGSSSESFNRRKRGRSRSNEVNRNPSRDIKTKSKQKVIFIFRVENFDLKISPGFVKRDQSKSRSKSPGNSAIKNKVTLMISEKNQSKIFIPGYDGPLVSLSLFNELQHNILPIETIESAYKEYKSKYEQKKFQSFYVEHKDDEWLKEKYDPESSKKCRGERNSQCQKLAQKFSENNLKNLKLELRESDENNRNIKILIYGFNREKGEFEEKERDLSMMAVKSANDTHLDISAQPYFGFDPDKLTLFLNQIPTNVSRWQILEVIKRLPGFISMSLSEPIKNQNYLRYCWVAFDSEDNCDLAYESLNDYRISSSHRISPIKSKSSTLKRVRITPPLFEERLVEDLELSRSLLQIFDKEKEISDVNLFEETRQRELQLDLQILYLRRVHGFCYYCLEEQEDERALATKCDNIHLRHYRTIGKRNDNLENFKYEAEWDRNFSRLLKEKIENKIDCDKNKSQIEEELNKRRNEYCKDNTSSVSAERFVCNICQKMFKGPNFVYNHIFNKHTNSIQENVDKEFYENVKYENYVKDPNKLYEKYKVISGMDEYLKYLNTIKSFQQGGVPMSYDNRRPQSSGGKFYKERERSDRGDNRRRRRDYKDYDAPSESGSNVQSSGRQLISYDDL